MTTPIIVSTGFEGGSAILTGIDGDHVRIRLRPDGDSPDFNWFYLRVSGVRGRDLKVSIENASDLSRLAGREEVPDCWTGYRPFVSDDLANWRRSDASYSDGTFTMFPQPVGDTVWIAYYPPFPMARHDAMIARAVNDPRCRLETLTTTPDGNDIDLLRIGTSGEGKPKAWIIGRQHPSETMAGFFAEGLLKRLLDPADGLGRHLCETLDIFVVPTVNPDGCLRGNTRMNARGMNLNRAWRETDPETAPEVAALRERMRAEGVDFCLDAHGDEELPYIFLGGPLEIPSRSDRLARLFRDFATALGKATPAYSLSDPYPGGPPAEADMRMAWNSIAEEFDCLSILLEMPFKDCHRDPDPDMGWSPDRCARLGASMLDAIEAVRPKLRPAG
ncbi:M14-type cytosolic carboxypeptidase [Pelagovum pacificum]|uniref:Carboxypeptidase family protein n=1 Tax=Pelagovum pacificum TaxID=2588711 RepID=A0A5C5GAM3_9RHOB|nr:M14-type cytosolic carboxypeptidase [Pelagovum pacificum]QQA41953.1 hypothetical protein I8N54_14270 [Pelagovum pacificum]TNY30607.1 carboxypeptidase family protein [Pelagovum pacificum]